MYDTSYHCFIIKILFCIHQWKHASGVIYNALVLTFSVSSDLVMVGVWCRADTCMPLAHAGGESGRSEAVLCYSFAMAVQKDVLVYLEIYRNQIFH